MPITLKLSDDEMQYLNQQGLQEFQAQVDKFAVELLAEAGRVEAVNRSTDGAPEITSSLVRDANILLRRGYHRQSKSAFIVGAQIVAAVGGFVTGLLTDIEWLKETSHMVVFILVLTSTITATVIAVMKG